MNTPKPDFKYDQEDLDLAALLGYKYEPVTEDLPNRFLPDSLWIRPDGKRGSPPSWSHDDAENRRLQIEYGIDLSPNQHQVAALCDGVCIVELYSRHPDPFRAARVAVIKAVLCQIKLGV